MTTSILPFPDFAVSTSCDGDQAVVGVRGEVDMVTAPTVGAALGVLVDQGHPDVVLDLAGLNFMDAAGLSVLAHTAERLATFGRVLTVRSAPRMTRRILQIGGMSDLVAIEEAGPVMAVLVAEQTAGGDSLADAGEGADLASELERLGSVRATEGVIDAALRLVTALASATVEGADGASVCLERHGRLLTVASSNDTVLRMDGHQYETGEGPCVAAAAEGRSFHVESLGEEDRWQGFVPLAIAEGIASILSTPLFAGDRPVGALNIYSDQDRAFGPHQQELAALLANKASGILACASTAATTNRWARASSTPCLP